MAESTPLEFKQMKEDASVTIEVPTVMYKRIRDLLMIGMPYKDLKSVQKILATIKNSDEDPDPITYHSRTLIWLLSKIEDAAEKEGKTETHKVEPKPES